MNMNLSLIYYVGGSLPKFILWVFLKLFFKYIHRERSFLSLFPVFFSFCSSLMFVLDFFQELFKTAHFCLVVNHVVH